MFLSNNFLGIPEAENTLEKRRVVVLPFPYERSVTYGVPPVLHRRHHRVHRRRLRGDPPLARVRRATVLRDRSPERPRRDPFHLPGRGRFRETAGTPDRLEPPPSERGRLDARGPGAPD